MKIRKGQYGWKAPPLDWIKIRKGEYGIWNGRGGNNWMEIGKGEYV